MRYVFSILTILLLAACGNDSSNKTATIDSTTSPSTSGSAVSDVRDNPQSTPVQSYERKVQDDLNNWFFRVQLYETKQRFVYKLRMEYEAIKEEQEIAFPNLNQDPKPEIRKGQSEYEAIIGFLDEKGEFKEYLKVYVEKDNLKLKQLKYYAVRTK